MGIDVRIACTISIKVLFFKVFVVIFSAPLEGQRGGDGFLPLQE
jgi:hypothetical protein